MRLIGLLVFTVASWALVLGAALLIIGAVDRILS
jgi:hypothetical protein